MSRSALQDCARDSGLCRPCCLCSPSSARRHRRQRRGNSTCTSRRRTSPRRAAPRCSPKRSKRRPAASSRCNCICPARCRSARPTSPRRSARISSRSATTCSTRAISRWRAFRACRCSCNPTTTSTKVAAVLAALHREGVCGEGLDRARRLQLSDAGRVGEKEARVPGRHQGPEAARGRARAGRVRAPLRRHLDHHERARKFPPRSIAAWSTASSPPASAPSCGRTS